MITAEVPEFSMFGTNPITIRILLANGDNAESAKLLNLLRGEYDCERASTLDSALARIAAREFSVIICDLGLGAEDDFDFIPHVSFASPKTVLIMTGGQIDSEET